MTSFIRPEARDAILRWKEALFGALLVALGARWGLGHGLMQWVGLAFVIIGVIVLYTGVQRARFRAGSGGPGVVRVDEGEITYYGPLNGGSVSIADLTALYLTGGGRTRSWILHQPGREDLHVPLNAEGGEQLFDTFASLPGLRTEHMLSQMKARSLHPVVIWQKEAARLH